MQLEPGDHFGTDIEIVREIGRGAFSMVYEVESPRHGGRLALKVSHEPVTDEEVAQRALREVTIQKGLRSPNVARVYEHGLRPDGHFYVLMDLISGAALNEHWRFGTPMPVDDAIDIVLQVCEALDLLHEEGIVHRDMKPGNILIEARTSRVFVVDFGLARSWNDSEPHGITATVGHKLVGTPHYAQPEQVDGADLTPAADVYSLAMIFYEMITGYTPFDAEDDYESLRRAWRDTPIRWITAHVRAPVIRASRHLPGLPRAIDDALAAALSKDPADRPQRAAEFARRLEG